MQILTEVSMNRLKGTVKASRKNSILETLLLLNLPYKETDAKICTVCMHVCVVDICDIFPHCIRLAVNTRSC